MTNEEALNMLQNGLLPEIRGMYYGAYYDALEMAIEALQKEPCEDLKDALNIAQTDRDKWAARAQKLAKIIGIRDCDIDEYEQQHYTDYISRQAAIDLCERFDGCVPYSVLSNYDMLPSVTPRQEPCEERKDGVLFMQDDLISKQQVIDAVCRWGLDNERNGKLMITMAEAKQSIVDLLDTLPPVTPQPKMGTWIESHIPESTLCECSVCGFSCGAYSFNFCPNCGAKMEMEET